MVKSTLESQSTQRSTWLLSQIYYRFCSCFLLKSFTLKNSRVFLSSRCLIFKVLSHRTPFSLEALGIPAFAALSVSQAAWLSYHTQLRLSSAFFEIFFSLRFPSGWPQKRFNILPHSVSFVKCFFRLFSRFSSGFRFRLPRLKSALTSYHIFFGLSRPFFNFFSRPLPLTASAFGPLSQALDYNTTGRDKSQHFPDLSSPFLNFFKKVFGSFLCLPLYKRDGLWYNSRRPGRCRLAL